MALEPITRQEQIIAGKDLEPITRMEKFLKEYGGGGGEYFETVGGDTLTWDGNTEGLTAFGTFYKVSDNIVTTNDLQNGGKAVYGTTTISFTSEEVVPLADNLNGVMHPGSSAPIMFFAHADNIDMGDGDILSEKGIYFAQFDAEGYTKSLTINGYTGFTTTKLKEEYLPSGATTFYIDTSGTDTYLYVDSNRTTKATKSDVEKAIMAGAVNCYGDGLYFFPVVLSPDDDAAALMIPAPGPNDTLMYIPYYTAEYTG